MTDRPVIVIDPGHGGVNVGASWPFNEPKYFEKDLTLKIALATHNLLRHSDLVVETLRYSDEDLTFGQRGALSRKYGAHLVLCIHVNSGKPSYHGMEAYYWTGNMLGRQIARTIVEAAPLELRTGRVFDTSQDMRYKKDWKARPRRVIGCHRATAVLIECGYLSSTRDRESYLLKPEGIREIACAIAAGGLRAAKLFA